MWANNKSCDILFWHLAQRHCTSNPEMNFHANPDYYNARQCPKQPIKSGWGDMNLVNEVQRKTRPPNQNQFKYKLHKLNAQTRIISVSLTPNPFFRTLKSHNRFPFSSNSELLEKKKSPDSFWFLSFLWRENKGVLWNTASLKGKLVRWSCCGMTWSGLVHTTAPPFIHKNTNLKADAFVLRADTCQLQPW